MNWDGGSNTVPINVVTFPLDTIPTSTSDCYGINVRISFGTVVEEPSVYFLEVYERLCKNRPFNYGDGCTGNRRYTFCVYMDGFVEPSL